MRVERIQSGRAGAAVLETPRGGIEDYSSVNLAEVKKRSGAGKEGLLPRLGARTQDQGAGRRVDRRGDFALHLRLHMERLIDLKRSGACYCCEVERPTDSVSS